MSKMSIDKKVKLIYSAELIFFAVVFAVIATLEITGVLKLKQWVMIGFNFLTLAGGIWLIADLIWALASPRRKQKSSIMDKAMLAPLGLALIIFDIVCFAIDFNAELYYFRMYSMTAVFYYIAIVYIFQGIYHYYHPIPAILESIEEEKQDALKEAEEDKNEKEDTFEETIDEEIKKDNEEKKSDE